MDTQTATLTTRQVANRLVELCRQGNYDEAHKELYADDAVSIEPNDVPGMPREVKGLEAIHEKGRKFQEMVETVHDTLVTEPVVVGNLISMGLVMDTTMKDHGRTKMEEICLYKVKDGKIIHEQFFF